MSEKPSPDSELSHYECAECGYRLTVDEQPLECPECGGMMRNVGTRDE